MSTFFSVPSYRVIPSPWQNHILPCSNRDEHFNDRDSAASDKEGFLALLTAAVVYLSLSVIAQTGSVLMRSLVLGIVSLESLREPSVQLWLKLLGQTRHFLVLNF